jgi:hypothetical protein
MMRQLGSLKRVIQSFMEKEEKDGRVAALVHLSVLGWSATILTAGYLNIIKADPTFVASIFTGCLAHYGITRTGQSKDDSKKKPPTADPQPVKKP